MISTRKRCDDLSMISIARRMLSDLHVVLSGTSSGFILMLTGETSLLLSSDIHCIHTRMSQRNCTSAAFFVVRVMAVEMYGKSWFACLQVCRLYVLYMVGLGRARGIQ